MTRSLLALALSISALFNVFFLAGFMKARHESRTDAVPASDGTVHDVASVLSLDESQRALFANLLEAVQTDRSELREGRALARQQLLDELGREQPDLERVREILARDAEMDRRHRSFAAQRFGEFMGVLTSEQRESLLRRVPGPPERSPGPWRELLERFDENADGTLDDAERAKAETFLEERRRERELRRAEMQRRFDRDGDGKLSPEELREMRRAFGDQHPPRRGPGGRGGFGGRGGPEGRERGGEPAPEGDGGGA